MKFNSLIESGLESLGIRFTFVNILPTMLLVIYTLLIVWSGAPRQTPNLENIPDKIKALETSDAVSLVLFILAIAILTQPLQFWLVRFLEGYWGTSVFGWSLTKLGVGIQNRKRKNLENKQMVAGDGEIKEHRKAEMISAAARLRAYFPAEDRTLPTSLGNVLRAAEDLAGRRYGLDAVVMWPRLTPLVSEKLSAILADQRNQLDIATRFCAIYFIAVPITVGLLFAHGWWILVSLLPLFLAWVSYRAAIASALAYGISIQTAFDLHRFDLYKALNIPKPENRDQEKEANQQLSLFIRQGIPVNLAYGEVKAKPSAPSRKMLKITYGKEDG